MSRAAKTRSFHTNLEAYVRDQYADFAKLIDYCQLFRVLSPRPGANNPGITLIIPSDETLKEITTNSFSANPEQVSRACETILSLVIRRAIRNSADWELDDIVDMRFPSRKIIAKVTSDSRVDLVSASGTAYATIEIDSDFRPAFRSNIAVWKMTQGNMDLDASKEAPRSPARAAAPRKRTAAAGAGQSRARGSREGGYDVAREHANSARFKIAIAAENEHATANAFARTGAARGPARLSPFLAYTISFARYACDKWPDMFYTVVLPLIRYRVTDFYTIFEPHRASAPDDYLVPDECIAEWFNDFQYRAAVQEDIIAFRTWIDEHLARAASQTPCAIYSHANELIDAIDSERMRIIKNIQNPLQLVRAIRATYNSIATTNTIGDIANVYPQPLADYYKRHHCAKHMQDELAFVIEPMMVRLESRFDLAQFRATLTIIGNVMHATDDEAAKKIPLANESRLHAASLQSDALVQEIHAFINSTMFLWIPLTSALIKQYPIQSTSHRPQDTFDELFNTDLALALHHERIFGPTEQQAIARANSAVALAALKALAPENISPELQAHIKTIARA